MFVVFYFFSLPKRQPLIKSEQTKFRTKDTLVAVGESNVFILNEIKQKWETLCKNIKRL